MRRENGGILLENAPVDRGVAAGSACWSAEARRGGCARSSRKAKAAITADVVGRNKRAIALSCI
jgi:hypothetical protein